MKKPPLEEKPIVFHRHVPYRGEAWPHYPNPRKQLRDLKGEKHQYISSFAVTILASFIFLGIGVMNFQKDHDDIALFVFIFISIILITIAISQINAARSINKFRPGYDIDISEWPREIRDHYDEEQQHDQKSDDGSTNNEM